MHVALSLRVEARNEGDGETNKMQASYRRAGRNNGGEDGGEFEGTYVFGGSMHTHTMIGRCARLGAKTNRLRYQTLTLMCYFSKTRSKVRGTVPNVDHEGPTVLGCEQAGLPRYDNTLNAGLPGALERRGKCQIPMSLGISSLMSFRGPYLSRQ